jgi:serine protease Do
LISVNAERILLAIALAAAPPLAAQQSLEHSFRTTGTAVVAAFDAQRAVLQTSSAVILDGRKEVNYGVVISADGHILTKFSEIEGIENLSVTVDLTKYGDVALLATDPVWDVALLKVDAAGLVPVEFAPTSAVPQGTWVVANGVTSRTRRRALAGIVSANSRPIPAAGGLALGLMIQNEKGAVVINQVVEGGGAAQAGILAGDVLLSIEGRPVAKVEDVAGILETHKAGDVVKVACRRGKEEIAAEVVLGAKGEMFADVMNRNDMMSGNFSRRRSGFPRILQHDIPGAASITGGPLIDLEGRCIGMNIARANRAESFAIPVEELREIAQRLVESSAVTRE